MAAVDAGKVLAKYLNISFLALLYLFFQNKWQPSLKPCLCFMPKSNVFFSIFPAKKNQFVFFHRIKINQVIFQVLNQATIALHFSYVSLEFLCKRTHPLQHFIWVLVVFFCLI